MTGLLSIVLDGSPFSQTATSLAQALELVTGSFSDSDQIITSATLDGMQLSSAQLTEPDESAISGTLTLTTGSTRAILFDAIQAGLTELESLKEAHTKGANQIAAGNTHDAILGLRHIVTTWQQIEKLISFAANHFGASTTSIDDSIVQTLAGLGNDLRELARTISEEDYGALADCLMFDLQDRVDQCSTWLKSIATELAASNA
ncbi:MAG: hypothetical protein H6815_03660 [Phycisphaeraceae bacterium]|nr:hypothetical protein [Phycisphaerales bacterium]MCB9859525.1 hypothetical protein [Phycisphaeraceae bacterium]